MGSNKFCFVLMPFLPELNYFYLYIRDYLRRKHSLDVERGDHSILTKPLIEKIRDQIIQAHVIIADITGGNPNVFYELGLAHAKNKPVIFLTREPPEIAPVDIRQFEFIRYELDNHAEFLSALDKAISSVFSEPYSSFYDYALEALQLFNKETGSSFEPASIDEFKSRVKSTAYSEGVALDKDEPPSADFLLPKIVRDVSNASVIKKIFIWIDSKY